eukprot:ANDGO_04940.mRNA.1 hypothetical protein PTSG_02244
MEFNPNQFETLANLLRNPEDQDETAAQTSDSRDAYSTPGQIGSSAQTAGTAESKKKVSNSKDIWDVDELEGTDYFDVDDGRKAPLYEIKRKTRVRSEDVFLGIDFDRSGMEDLVIVIELPDTRTGDVSLDVTASALRLFSPKFKLNLPFPRKVDNEKGRAQFVKDKEQLVLTLPIVDEL